ncbi:MAG: amidohydrolase family protein, partial [Acidimicrobiales bacterium]|nr:amidohydrolase family protein [Acidimicrobiales bacterium]
MTSVSVGNESSVGSRDPEERVVVISCDTHVGPDMSQLRPYCEARYIDDFDRLSKAIAGVATEQHDTVDRYRTRAGRGFGQWNSDFLRAMRANTESSGEHDFDRRMKDLDRDGISGEVIFHGSQNINPLPFADHGQSSEASSLELKSAGIRIYNRWLADFVSVQPERHAGLAHLPVWDPEACVQEVEWARAAGLRGINLPGLRPYDRSIRLYNDPVWEPLWTASASLEMPLVNHSAPDVVLTRTDTVEAYSLLLIESQVVSRRFVPWLIYSGVFERHPTLQVVLTEYRPGPWIRVLLDEMDSAYYNQSNRHIRTALPKEPSQYWKQNVYMGASFLAHFEAQQAVREGRADHLMWGSDYPHIEGSWPNSVASMRKTFEGVDPDVVKDILGATAAKVYGFDLIALQNVADR